jgi:hypothetical protein
MTGLQKGKQFLAKNGRGAFGISAESDVRLAGVA